MRILAVRVGRVGDTVMMTPALNAILQCYPQAEITILTSPEGKLLLSDFHPNIKQLWTWDRHGFFKSLSDKRRLLSDIHKSQFDKIYCFDTSNRIASLFDGTEAEFHWFHSAPEPAHTARYYLDLVASTCDVPVEGLYNYLPVDNNYRSDIDHELAELDIHKEDFVVMMHPTFSGYSKLGLRKRKARIRKLWPAEYYGQLGRRLSQQQLNGRRIRPLIALLPSEMPLGRKIVALSDHTITLLQSQPAFGRYKAMIDRANLLLTPDSGPMHIASALNTRIVAFFSMKDPGDCGPYMEPSRFTILRSDDPVKGIATIDVNTVYEAVMEQLLKENA
ncbi:MAG: glycosyltransferase family 9 protein [Gammaproteobacteria bacterium]|jgi:ADP-heptose:LPS heptosyltransferase